MNQHTPTPWGINPHRSSEVRQVQDGRPVGQLICDSRSFNVRVPWAQNAAYIAHAANCHDELLAALEDMLIVADEAGCNTLAQARARAAIAKAKGQA